MERAFRQALESIRALSPEERRAVRPLRLQVVTAAPGDTVDAFAARMATADRRPERFLDLNGLDRGANLRPGEQYKLVVE
jgi:predicted Zn-dependent protease